MNHINKTYVLALLISFIPAATYTATRICRRAYVVRLVCDRTPLPTQSLSSSPTPIARFDLHERSRALVLSERGEPLRNLQTKSSYLVWLKAMENDPRSYNPINNSEIEKVLPVFQDINGLIEENIAWSTIRKLGLEKYTLYLHKLRSEPEILRKQQKEYNELFQQRTGALSPKDFHAALADIYKTRPTLRQVGKHFAQLVGLEHEDAELHERQLASVQNRRDLEETENTYAALFDTKLQETMTPEQINNLYDAAIQSACATLHSVIESAQNCSKL